MSPTGRESPNTIANRLYLAGVSEGCTEQDIYETFANHYGYSSIEQVQIISYTKMKKSKQKRTNDPIAFVTCQNPKVVQQIIQDYTNSNNIESLPHTKPWKQMFQKMEMAVLPAKKQSKTDDTFHIIERFSQQTNVILQVNTTHVDRMVEFIQRELDGKRIKIIGTSKAIAPYQCVSFICIHDTSFDNGSNEDYLYNYLWSSDRPIISRCALIKMYRVQGVCSIPFQKTVQDKANHLVAAALDQWTMTMKQHYVLENDDYNRDLKLKVESCPSRLLQKSMVQALYNTLEDKSNRVHNVHSTIQMVIENNSHVLSAVKLYSPPKHTKLHEREYDLYMIGISRSLPNRSNGTEVNDARATNDNDDILCRAYYKLEEALDRYNRAFSSSMEDKYPIAFDCGSSPGGWTKYLIESLKCTKVYSCDPGALNPSVESLTGVHYLNMKGRDGMDVVCNFGDLINIWVSDMCLVDPSEQLNHLFAAYEKGILAPDAMFVLTIKCNTGHSKASYDKTCQAEVWRLEQTLEVTDIYICHLFSNRKGERTIMGRLNYKL